MTSQTSQLTSKLDPYTLFSEIVRCELGGVHVWRHASADSCQFVMTRVLQPERGCCKGKATRRLALKTGTRSASAIIIALLTSIFVAVFASSGFAQKWLPMSSSLTALVVPEPVKLKWKISEPFRLAATTVIVLPASSSREERSIAAWLKEGLHNFYGVDPEIMVTDLIPEQNAIVVGTVNDTGLKNLVSSLSTEKFGSFPEQSYVLSVSSLRVCLVGGGIKGLKYGAQTLIQAARMDNYIAEYVIPPVEIADFPSVDMRAFLLPLRDYRAFHQVWDAREFIDLAEMLHMNAVIIQVDNAIKFDSAPGVGRNDALQKDTLRALVKYAREAGLEVIPLVETFSHQDVLLCPAYPNLCLDKSTYDPSNPKVYTRLFGIIDEILEIFEPKYMHIAHDEIRAFSNIPKEKAAELFLSDVRKIHAHLKEKNVQTMMWAGMLLSSTQFPGQDNCNGLLGSTYALIDSLPKDIILMDAHYRQRKLDFPTVDYLISKGFQVVGCVYDDPKKADNFGRFPVANNFSKYVAGKDGKFLGMTVALWNCFNYDGMGTPRRILFKSNEAFWRGGIPAVDPMGNEIPPNLKTPLSEDRFGY